MGTMTAASVASWRRAIGLGCLAVYGPFLLMAFYTLAFVSCPHCKAAVWMLLPCAPGLLPTAAGRHWLALFHPSEALMFSLALIVSLATVLFLASLIRRGGWLRPASVVIGFAVFSVCAFRTLSLIRA